MRCVVISMYAPRPVQLPALSYHGLSRTATLLPLQGLSRFWTNQGQPNSAETLSRSWYVSYEAVASSNWALVTTVRNAYTSPSYVPHRLRGVAETGELGEDGCERVSGSVWPSLNCIWIKPIHDSSLIERRSSGSTTHLRPSCYADEPLRLGL
jgi:hypothetical protein